MENHPERNGDLYLLRLDEQGNVTGEPEVIVNRPTWEWGATFSPDGRWLLYSSAESGRGEVYVRPASGAGAAVQVSTDGGFAARWSPAEDRLFYTTFERMYSVGFSVEGETFAPDLPEPLFELEGGLTFWTYHVSPDGQRFCWTKPVDDDGQRDQPLVTLNWFEELAAKLPAQRK